MRYITEGLNAIDKKIEDGKARNKKKLEIIKHVKPEMPSTQIEAYIEDVIDEI